MLHRTLLAASVAVLSVKQALAELPAGKPISAAVTRPYGCSIKYKSAA